MPLTPWFCYQNIVITLIQRVRMVSRPEPCSGRYFDFDLTWLLPVNLIYLFRLFNLL
jgi:hypothetical protein